MVGRAGLIQGRGVVGGAGLIQGRWVVGGAGVIQGRGWWVELVSA